MRTTEHLEAVVERVRRTPLGERIPADWAALTDLPFTAKEDLREHYPLGLLAVPREALRRIHASSGSRGKPTIAAYTQHDLDVWSEVMAECMTMAGVKPGMVVHNAYGYGLFTGGLGFHQGAERIGALTIPVSGGVTARQALLLRDLQGQVLCSTPSYALHIAEGLREAGIGPDDLALEIGMFGAEPWTDAMRTEVEAALGLMALNVYGLSEIIGPGVAAECAEARDGLHVMEDHFLVEIIDVDSRAPVRDGEDGELVITTLTKEAMPLLRYRTGDITSLTREPCACGRTSPRISAIRGRVDDMLIIRGVNLYPSQIEEALLHVEGVAPHYQLIVDRPKQLDELTILCEGRGANLASRVKEAIREQVGVTAKVLVRPMGEIPRSEGKAVRVIDRRNLKQPKGV
ncbi:phenylacetate--CoA ligase [Solirubrobacter phytolaccae]|uniref:Phenylacetate-coenzyme A ligase n=1 Tax=Solirubrobacter phytolaccae TaxID=1404360 RepID=A0A9X3NAR8_9ACTN|nr:phenylacetate--CoA ligase [Solirubrobacter phytolaccae]MDA0181327.1 phenylacetate--CoA ligase [Solirubrobacter phytolaccae]